MPRKTRHGEEKNKYTKNGRRTIGKVKGEEEDEIRDGKKEGVKTGIECIEKTTRA